METISKMTLDEAIEYCKLKMDSKGNYSSLWHSQIYEWLKELKHRREQDNPNFNDILKEQDKL